jgi:signal transduction histidine kinase
LIGRSLRWRLLLGAMVAIFLALLVAWLFMTLLFERHLQRNLQAELTRAAVALVADLSLAPDGKPVLVTEPVDSRLRKPAGGYYWQITSGREVIASRSLWDAALPVPRDPPADGWRLRHASGPFQQPVALLERQLRLRAGSPPVLVQLAQDTRPLASARDEFGRELALFLVLLWLALSAAAWLQVSLGLRPLARVRSELGSLRANASARLPGEHLREIQPLADAINLLADARERDVQQARRRAADLAHGLKTPLAAMSAQSRRAREAGAVQAADGIDRAVAAIGATIDGELARARLAVIDIGQGGRAQVLAVAERLVTVLEHTERGEQLAFSIDVPQTLELPMRAEDLSELLGAVLENAARYAVRQVRLRAAGDAGSVTVTVEDDGPGIASERLDESLLRGSRLDESGPGQGLGLAIAREIAEATGGSVKLGRSPLGGLGIEFSWVPDSH